jgi:hypothetical protein
MTNRLHYCAHRFSSTEIKNWFHCNCGAINSPYICELKSEFDMRSCSWFSTGGADGKYSYLDNPQEEHKKSLIDNFEIETRDHHDNERRHRRVSAPKS